MFRYTALLIAGLLAPLSSFAQSTTEARWLEFQRNPRAVMEMNPVKKDHQGNPISVHIRLFNANDIKTGAFIEKKTKYRTGKSGGSMVGEMCTSTGVCLNDVIAGRSAAHGNVTTFLDMKEFKAKGVTPTASLEEMDANGLKSAKLAETPWSDTYWPIAQGIIGSRYSARSFSAVGGYDWKVYFDLVSDQKQSLRSIYESGDAKLIDDLSPSEKYDLLIGGLSEGGKTYDSGYLTPTMWKEGKGFYDDAGKVEDWMGICHGWSPASFMLPRPTKAVVASAADGKTALKFYPSDLKGLSSYLWAKANYPVQYLGGRCNEKTPKLDPDSGRILNEECFDTNPGNWHVAIVNQIGLAKRSLVIDATYDYEVWNQPVYSYSYRYFNPQTGKQVATLGEATIAVSDFTKDKFKKFRSSRTSTVVGIEMDLTYVVETNPTHRATNSPNDDSTQTATYMYDLELNEKNQIIGGEWYTNKHPDFLWLPEADARATGAGESQIPAGSWEPGQPLPKFWRDIAVNSAVKFGQPIAAIIEPLLEQAKK